MIVLTTRRAEITSRLITPGDYDEITLALFKKHLKWDASDISEDDLMTAYLTSAIKQAEQYTRRTISVASWATYLDGFQNFTFDVAPIDIDSIAVKYWDEANTEQTLGDAEYYVKNNGLDAYAEIQFTGTMPELYDREEPVWVEFDAGYATIPSDLAVIIMQQAADFFENRTNDIPGSLDQVTMDFHRRLFPYKML